jgi:hypothetical protein
MRKTPTKGISVKFIKLIFTLLIIPGSILLIAIGSINRKPDASGARADQVPDANTIITTSSVSDQDMLLKAYRNFLVSVKNNEVLWKDGAKMQWDDGRKKSFDEMLDDPDIQEMVLQKYPVGRWPDTPKVNFDPGRMRNESFFRKMYGASEAEARKNLVGVKWFGRSVSFSKINGAADSLRKVEKDL